MPKGFPPPTIHALIAYDIAVATAPSIKPAGAGAGAGAVQHPYTYGAGGGGGGGGSGAAAAYYPLPSPAHRAGAGGAAAAVAAAAARRAGGGFRQQGQQQLRSPASGGGVRAAPPAAAISGQMQQGKTFLSTIAKPHEDWPLGAIAELLHNAVDAGATSIKIMTHANKKDALRVDDNGSGMGFGRPTGAEGGKPATGMNKMMLMASDQKFGEASVKPGQVGGYGVGCKVGIIAVAHTGIIFTLGTTKVRGKDTKTVSIGLISNEPYEKRNEVPITEFVTIMAHNGRPIEGISTKEQKDKLLAKIEKLDSTIDQFFLAQWIAKVQ
eukprot:gene23353-31647_t